MNTAIGIVAGDLGDWALSQFVVGAEREARRRGHAVLITSAGGEPDDTAACVRALLERRVDGIVMFCVGKWKCRKFRANGRQDGEPGRYSLQ